MSNLHSILGDFLPSVEQALDDACLREEGCPPRLCDAMRYSLLAPGKRLRPCLVLAAAECCGGDLKIAMPAAVAVEMVHAYSLVHDDLPAMDDDDLRRGRPTCHREFDEAIAILVGDALLAKAFEILASGLEPTRAAEAVKVLARAAGPTALVGGQADDLADHQLSHEEKTGAGSFNRIAELESIHQRKTGALFRACLELGAISVGAEPEKRGWLVQYAADFGLAFQITDDLLDYLGNPEELGKQTGKDIERGKLTFPGLLGIEASQSRAIELTASACQSAKLFGPRGQRLVQLAEFMLQRSR